MAVLFGWVAHALERANITKVRFREHMQVVNEDMGFRGLDRATKDRICKRYEYAWRKHRDYLKKPEDSFMDRLCPSFNLERLKHVTDAVASMIYEKDMDLAEASLDDQGQLRGEVRRGIAALATRLQPMFFLPRDVLMYEGDVATQAFFLVRGEVEVLVVGKPVHTIGDNEFFGEISLLAQADELWARVEYYARRLRKKLGDRSNLVLRNGTVTATMLCDVLSLKLDDLREVHKIFPEIIDRVAERTVRRLGLESRSAHHPGVSSEPKLEPSPASAGSSVLEHVSMKRFGGARPPPKSQPCPPATATAEATAAASTITEADDGESATSATTTTVHAALAQLTSEIARTRRELTGRLDRLEAAHGLVPNPRGARAAGLADERHEHVDGSPPAPHPNAFAYTA
jgi:CRP-like cAMP-binding protein